MVMYEFRSFMVYDYVALWLKKWLKGSISRLKDPDEKIMDAKVLRKGEKKLIVVDLPNPKGRWMKPN